MFVRQVSRILVQYWLAIDGLVRLWEVEVPGLLEPARFRIHFCGFGRTAMKQTPGGIQIVKYSRFCLLSLYLSAEDLRATDVLQTRTS